MTTTPTARGARIVAWPAIPEVISYCVFGSSAADSSTTSLACARPCFIMVQELVSPTPSSP